MVYIKKEGGLSVKDRKCDFTASYDTQKLFIGFNNVSYFKTTTMSSLMWNLM